MPGLATDTITFAFKLVDATVTYQGNKIIVDGPSGSHTVLTGFEVFNFTDGTVHNDDGSPLIDDLFYYAKYHDVWTAHVDADAHYNVDRLARRPRPERVLLHLGYLSANPDVKAAASIRSRTSTAIGWKEGRMPSITFDPAQYLAANPDVRRAASIRCGIILQNGYQEGRQPFAPTELIAANGFDYVYYLNHNPDVAAAGVDPFQHFQTVGWKEGRNPNALFDTNGYLDDLPRRESRERQSARPLQSVRLARGPRSVGRLRHDVVSCGLRRRERRARQSATHFLEFGIHEGRSPFADGVWG